MGFDGNLADENPIADKAGPIRITRKTFLKATSVSAALFSVGGISAITTHGAMLRPPGGQDEQVFVAGCNRCGRCISVCHTAAIGIASLSTGLLAARTPVMRYNLGFCDFCGDCAEVCPTGALRRFDVEAAQAGNVAACCVGKAELDRKTCLAWISSSCNLCYEKCPFGAVVLNGDGLPIVDATQCNGCGICEYVCPVLSLRSYIGGTKRAIVVEPVSNYESEAS